MEEGKVKKNTLFRSILKAIKKRLKPTHILLLALLLGTNAFAWYIYMEKISSDINVRVKSWNVSFSLNNQQMTDYINFTIDEMYPGMTPYQAALSVTNDSEVAAQLTYEIVSFKVFDQLLTTENNAMTEAQIIQAMNNNYPFHITVSTNQSIINGSGGTATFYINATWPYESVNGQGVSNDAADTYWGNTAYTYKAAHPTLPCIIVKIKLSAVQVDPNNNNNNNNNNAGGSSGGDSGNESNGDSGNENNSGD